MKYETPFVWIVITEEDGKPDTKEIHHVTNVVLAYTIDEAIQVAIGTGGTFRYVEDLPKVIEARRVTHILSSYNDRYKIVKVEEPKEPSK